jgi:2'-5' RNA ligase
MQAIVTALDDPYRDDVENIWGELKAVFGLQSVSGSTRPHFTYHVAEQYSDRIADVLAEIARSSPAFEIETHGLGVFRGDELVVYLHVTKSDALVAMHERIWSGVADVSADAKPVYAAETWVPHITLAIGDIDEGQLPAVLQFLNRREYRWRIPATNLCLIDDTSSAAAEWRRYELTRA